MGDYKFKAFISYSHADEQWGAWLQRSLERFRAPTELARQLSGNRGPLRLAPVFRDREDLPAAGNLNDAIQKALGESEFQIVLCSPNAARSRWVNEEIKLFHRLHGPGRTFAIIIDGEPGGGNDECFPPALRFRIDADGALTNEPAEPLAADAREGGDGKRYALLKTAAGMLGVGLDDLVRRDARARARRARAIAAGASAIAASMTFAAIFAFNQRNEAQLMRGKAETLVEFMLSDLSDRLEPVGKLDILEVVGAEALSYYQDQDLKTLDAGALSRRARALMKLGQVDQRRGDLDAALKAYRAAAASTEEQLKRAPNDPTRIFDHAQSVFYLGDVATVKGDLAAGDAGMNEYLQLAERLVAIDADNPKWRLELAYATSNLGAAAFNRGAYSASIPFFERSVEARRQLHEQNPDDRKIALAYAYALSWLGVAELTAGKANQAIDALRSQLDVYDAVHDGAAGPDYQIMEAQVTAERRLASAYLALGRLEAAAAVLEKARIKAQLLVERDSSNVNVLVNASAVERFASSLAEAKGMTAASIDHADRAIGLARQLAGRNPADIGGKAALCLALARRAEAGGFDPAVQNDELAQIMRDFDREPVLSDVDAYAAGAIALAHVESNRNNKAGARAIAASAVARILAHPGEAPTGIKLSLGSLYYAAGDSRAAAEIVSELAALEYIHPRLDALKALLESDSGGAQ